jgi:hypothetical protein
MMLEKLKIEDWDVLRVIAPPERRQRFLRKFRKIANALIAA